MCGIVGIYSTADAPVDGHVVLRMMDAQRHRGPDDEGARLFSLRRRVSEEMDRAHATGAAAGFEGGIGFNRLSILDLSSNGHQPMASDDGSVFIAFNGEIYNAFDYRPELIARGHTFHSQTDTEVILRLYEEYGLDGMLERLNGMFAICIVDLRAQRLHLVRDRLGIKPVYWTERDGLLLFASEAKSLLQHPQFHAELDFEALDDYMAFRFSAPTGFMLKGVQQLEAGHVLTVAPDEPVRIRAFWTIPDAVPERQPMRQTVCEVEERLRHSVQMRLLSDVPVGTQLSGGIDSSLVAAYASDAREDGIDAIGITLAHPYFNEEPWMDRVTERAQVRVHKFEMDEEYFAAHFPRAVWHMDQPLNYANSVGMYYIAHMARPLVTVLLSGEGSDELFAGYGRFFHYRLGELLGPALPLVERLPRLRNRVRMVRGDWNRKNPVEAFITGVAHVRPDDIRRLYPDARPEDALQRRTALFGDPGRDFIAAAVKYELRTHLTELLMRQDKMTMAHSMEDRVPYLDHTLVEYARTIPTRQLVRGLPHFSDLSRSFPRNTKMPLKHLAAERWDEDFAYRRKGGFNVSLTDYFNHPVFVARMEDELLPAMRERGLFDRAFVEREWAAVRGGAPLTNAFWAATCFEQWARFFLDGTPPPPMPEIGAPQQRPEAAAAGSSPA